MSQEGDISIVDPNDPSQMTNNPTNSTKSMSSSKGKSKSKRDIHKISDHQKPATDLFMNQNPLATYQSDRIESIDIDHNHQDASLKQLKSQITYSIGDKKCPMSST